MGILPSPSNIALRGVMAGGASSMTWYNDGTVNSLTYTFAGGETVLTLGSTGTFPAPSDYFHVANGFAGSPASQIGYITITGCDSTPGMNREFTMKTATTTAFTSGTATMAGSVSATNPYQIASAAAVCVGNWVTITSRAGTLIDSKAIAIGDRVKYLANSITATSNTEQKSYETRTVDKIWGTGQEVTLFTVKDGYNRAANTLQDSLAWVDESGSTEDSECSARGLCDGESGVCECFSGYTGQSCELQNALNQ